MRFSLNQSINGIRCIIALPVCRDTVTPLSVCRDTVIVSILALSPCRISRAITHRYCLHAITSDCAIMQFTSTPVLCSCRISRAITRQNQTSHAKFHAIRSHYLCIGTPVLSLPRNAITSHYRCVGTPVL